MLEVCLTSRNTSPAFVTKSPTYGTGTLCIRNRASIVRLSGPLQMCVRAGWCRSSKNCRRCSIVLTTPRSGGETFATRTVLLELYRPGRSWYPVDSCTNEAIVYDYVVLHFTYTTVRIGLFVVAATFWILYFHEVLFRSGRIRTQWLKRRLTDLALLLLIALVSSLFFLILSGARPSHPH
jgi:hypothetical protein